MLLYKQYPFKERRRNSFTIYKKFRIALFLRKTESSNIPLGGSKW